MERDDQLRGALGLLREPVAEPPMRDTVADYVRIGRARRIRRQRWFAGGVAVMVLAGVGATLGVPRLLDRADSAVPPGVAGGTPVRTGDELDRLVGYWTISGTNEAYDGGTLMLGASGAATVRRECGDIWGTWTASPAGGFLALVHSFSARCGDERTWSAAVRTPAWLEQAVAYHWTDGSLELVARDGSVTAQLDPASAPSATADGGGALALGHVNDTQRRAFAERSVPAGITPPTWRALVGTWVPVEATSPGDASSVVFAEDGGLTSTNRCGNQLMGSWTLDPSGAALFLYRGSGGPAVRCPGGTFPGTELTSALQVDRLTLTAYDPDAQPVVTLVQPHSTPPSTSGDEDQQATTAVQVGEEITVPGTRAVIRVTSSGACLDASRDDGPQACVDVAGDNTDLAGSVVYKQSAGWNSTAVVYGAARSDVASVVVTDSHGVDHVATLYRPDLGDWNLFLVVMPFESRTIGPGTSRTPGYQLRALDAHGGVVLNTDTGGG